MKLVRVKRGAKARVQLDKAPFYRRYHPPRRHRLATDKDARFRNLAPAAPLRAPIAAQQVAAQAHRNVIAPGARERASFRVTEPIPATARARFCAIP